MGPLVKPRDAAADNGRVRRGFLALLVVAALFGGSASEAMAQAQPGGSGWSATAASYRGQDGSQYAYTCPAYGTAGALWGTDVYTDDSSVCTAGVHTGQITLAGGGTVTIEIRPGEASYTGSTRNRITSSSYPAWGGSYVVVGAQADQPPVGDGGTGWGQSAAQFRSFPGAQVAVQCPAGGPIGVVWGTNVYTDDSSVCTAGVHAGVIEVNRGGRVLVEMVDGQQSYTGSTREGVKSNSYPAWHGSFIVVGSPYGGDNFTGSATGEVTVNGRPYRAGPIPYNSTIDVTRGTLQLTATGVGTVVVTGDQGLLARFVLKKASTRVGDRRRTVAELALTGGSFADCPAPARAGAAQADKAIRSLWAKGKGRFRTKGRFSTATVKGTRWNTTDRCDGTLTTVTEGSVSVKDVSRRQPVVVRAGRSYLARRR